MEGYMGMEVAILRDIQWGSNLVQMMEMRWDNPMGCQVGIFMENLSNIHWKSHLVHMVELRQAPLMVV